MYMYICIYVYIYIYTHTYITAINIATQIIDNCIINANRSSGPHKEH